MISRTLRIVHRELTCFSKGLRWAQGKPDGAKGGHGIIWGSGEGKVGIHSRICSNNPQIFSIVHIIAFGRDFTCIVSLRMLKWDAIPICLRSVQGVFSGVTKQVIVILMVDEHPILVGLKDKVVSQKKIRKKRASKAIEEVGEEGWKSQSSS